MKLHTVLATAISTFALVATLMIPSYAEDAPVKKIPNHPRVNQVNQRRANQRARIHQGVKSGQLTGHEQHNLNRQEHGIHTEEKDMRSEDNGHLTGADQKALNQQQNHVSNEIFKDKHNDATQPGVAPATP